MVPKVEDVMPVEEILPDRRSLSALREAAADCKACPLWRSGTQTVFGEGKRNAEVMLVGEQPGDREDRAGRPFVGPAGDLLDRALAEAEIDRRSVYVTNVVKHFKWEARGKRRIHKKPNASEIRACKPWLENELHVVKPSVVVCLGATAAQALLGAKFRVTQERGRFVDSDIAEYVTATIHPSSILRAPDEDARREGFESLVSDLGLVRSVLARSGST
jgi:uracil-DNA glycosylase